MHGPPPPPPRPRDPRRLARLEQNANAAPDNPAVQVELYKVRRIKHPWMIHSFIGLGMFTRNCDWQGDPIR